MEVVKYKEIKEKIRNYYQSKINIEIYIERQEEKEKIISNIFKEENIEKLFGLFKVIKLDDLVILEYETSEASKNRKEENIVVIGKDNHMFRICHQENYNNDYYEKDNISIYDENKYLINRICCENIFNITRIKLLDKTSSNKYYKRDYTFYEHDNRTVSLRINDEMYFENENSYNSRLNTANSLTRKISIKIKDELDKILGLEKVKEYQITRKKQGL